MEWAWDFRSADPLSWLTAGSFQSHQVIPTDRHFILNFRPANEAPHDLDRGEKKESELKETAGQQRVVYVIDDDAPIQESLKSLLGSLGSRVQPFAPAQKFFANPLPHLPIR